ncbi:hypothetical protein IV55_GL001717 [Furfurilactobacillus siliginis]|nr:hypothetical protein IV55_GL001717 [Furfurilactobacillus siliginis]
MFVWRDVEDRKVYWITFAINALIAGIIYGFLNVHVFEIEDHIENPQQFLRFIIACLFAVAEFSSTARRLHDSNRSNWWIFISIIPIIGPIWFFFLLIAPGKEASRWRTK